MLTPHLQAILKLRKASEKRENFSPTVLPLLSHVDGNSSE